MRVTVARQLRRSHTKSYTYIDTDNVIEQAKRIWRTRRQLEDRSDYLSALDDIIDTLTIYHNRKVAASDFIATCHQQSSRDF